MTVSAAVIFANGERYNVSGRVAEMIRYLCSAAEKIERVLIGRVHFHYQGSRVSWSLEEHMGGSRWQEQEKPGR